MNKLNPLLKLISFLTIGTLSFLTSSLTGLILILVPLFIIFAWSDIKWKSFFNTLKMSLFLFIFLLLIYWFTIDSGEILYWMGNVPVYQGSYHVASLFAMRIWIILLSGTIFTKTTSDINIAHSFTYLIYPLKFIKVPIDRIGITLAISLKFIPEFTFDTKQIIIAKKLRANHLSRWAIWNRTTLFLGLFTPLFVFVFKNAVSTYNALYIAGYDVENNKTKYRRFKWSYKDSVFLLLLGSFVTITILVIMGFIPLIFDYYYW